jgi:aspartate 4-decarboxylase
MPRTWKQQTRSKQTKKRMKKSVTNSIQRIKPELFKKLNDLSPFELKNRLIKLAEGKKPSQMLNAGRGNPNFFNSFARKVFASLQNTCVEASTHFEKDLVLYPSVNDHNYEKVFNSAIKKWPQEQRDFFHNYIRFLKNAARNTNQSPNAILHDLFLSTLGTFYPSPPQIQPHLNLVARDFMYELVLNRNAATSATMKRDDFEYFATEGAAAGILYVFNSLKANRLLKKGDHIALITPIFSPYLEMPVLKDPDGYGLKLIELKADPNKDYELPDSEIAKLKDKRIKALFMVNPHNPGAYSLSKANIMAIGNIVNKERQDLIVLSDNVYAPFAPKYYSFMMSCPRNTIEVFSLSKYFGTTGWRLGICMIAKENRITKMIQNLPPKDQNALALRYDTVSIDPKKLTFMERLVNDSRQVAMGHVAGLSTPQQALIGLFFYYQLSDRTHQYQDEIRNELKRRITTMYTELKTDPDITPEATNYYSMLNIPQIAENLYGKKAREHIVSNYEYLEFLFHLARVYHVVLLPGSGFGSAPWYIRVSLANLTNEDYQTIGVALRNCIADFAGKHK